uniref:AP-4 complex accessory subunit Tepsin VHS/ENTH-like domain-containing protein n=1 Tax=Mola mola TaxID=94237 RepID=A0A3Q3VNK0_MOLML
MAAVLSIHTGHKGDDENPCPGYLFQEIGKISHESSGYGQCLLEHLLERLQVESCHVKLKVLKIFIHLCSHGSNQFLTELRRNSTFIQQASVYSGPPDPIHGTALYQKVRNTAQVRCRLRLSIMSIAPFSFYPGMGSGTSHRSGMQGFGYNLGRQGTALTKRCPGQVGGGWEETDSSNSSSHNSSQDIAANSMASAGSKSAGTGSQSEASRESSSDLSERVEALQLGDCGQEMALIGRLTEGSRVFLSREESQHFVKECSILNCEVVLEMISCKLQDPSDTIKMRALCAVSCLLTSDLLSLEQILGATQRRLRQLSEGTPGPIANKATKVIVNHPSSPVSQAMAQRHSLGKLMNDRNEERVCPVQQESFHNQLNPGRTAEVSDFDTDKCSSPTAEPQPEKPHESRLSLFAGMELVTKGRPLCQRETDTTGDSVTDNPDPNSPNTCNSVASESSQPVSAFSFLNF